VSALSNPTSKSCNLPKANNLQRAAKILSGALREAVSFESLADSTAPPSPNTAKPTLQVYKAGGMNVVEAIKAALNVSKESLDIYLVLHSYPQHTLTSVHAVVRPFLTQATHKRLHVTAFHTTEKEVMRFARVLSKDGRGHYHFVENEGVFGDDIDLLVQELEVVSLDGKSLKIS